MLSCLLETVLWRNTHVHSQLVADFGLDHLWSVFNTSELQATDVLTVLFLNRTKKKGKKCIPSDTNIIQIDTNKNDMTQ